MSPNSPLLEILLIREMNKLEEHYFSPETEATKKAPLAVREYYVDERDQILKDWKAAVPAFAAFCQETAKQKSTSNKGLFAVAAAHSLLINKDYAGARKQLDEAKKLNLSSSTARPMGDDQSPAGHQQPAQYR